MPLYINDELRNVLEKQALKRSTMRYRDPNVAHIVDDEEKEKEIKIIKSLNMRTFQRF